MQTYLHQKVKKYGQENGKIISGSSHIEYNIIPSISLW